KYVNTNDTDLWKALPERTAGIWLDYRLAIESLYPGANSTRRYTNAELRAFVAERHLLRINTVDDLGDYHREFVRRATHLTAANRLSVADKDDLYFAGFPSRFQRKLHQRLLIRHPDHNEGDTFLMSKVYKTAGHILANTHSTLSTHSIECIVGEKRVEMGLIDSGAQIILIRRDLWHDLGLPLSVTNSLVMEGIASGRARTMGSIDNLRIRIGSVVFYAQAQVVENSPTRLLLGQPFLDITRAVLKPSDDGHVTITLHDPSNTDNIISIPT
ncbi:hypothetical protein BD410DRAFT_704986, partial [Rickenella mellea]